MDIATAIATINASELGNKAEVVAAIEALKTEAATSAGQVQGLTDEKTRLTENNSQLLRQRGEAKSRVTELEKQLSELVKAAGTDIEDEEAALAKLKTLAEDLKKAEENLATVTGERDTAIADKAKLQGEITYRDASTKLGVDPVVLQKLLELPADRIVIEGDEVKVKGEGENASTTAFKEFVEAQPDSIKRMVNLAMGTQDTGAGGGAGGADGTTSKRKTGPTAPPTQPTKGVKAGDVLGGMGFSGPPQAKATVGA